MLDGSTLGNTPEFHEKQYLLFIKKNDISGKPTLHRLGIYKILCRTNSSLHYIDHETIL